MTTQEMIEVMQAYDKGETIEVKLFGETTWETLITTTWDWQLNDYRIKPKIQKSEGTGLMIWKRSEGEPLHPKSHFYQSSYIKRERNVDDYVYCDDILWYWEYKDEDGFWHKTDYRATRAEIVEKLSNFSDFSPLYALGFRLP